MNGDPVVEAAVAWVAAAVWEAHEKFEAALARDRDRLVAERDEARQDAEDSATLAYEANEREKVLEGREAALREALTQIVSACPAGVPADEPAETKPA